MNPAPQRNRLRLARVAAVAATSGALVLIGSPAFAYTDADSGLHVQPVSTASHGSQASSEEKPAVVGPMLGLFGFGAGIGLPLVCQAGTSAIGSGAGEFGLAGQAGPVIGKLNDGCDTASTSGTTYVAKGQQLATPLNVINPYANQGLEAGAGAAEQYGEEYDETLSPFGPTVQGSGATLRWFEGR